MVERTKILLLIPHLGGGGAEHVIALLARGLSQEKYEVHLALVTADDAGPTPVPPWVTLHALDAGRVRGAAFPLLRLVWRLRPHIIISGAEHVNFMTLLLRPFFPPKTRLLVRQTATPSAVLTSGRVPRYTCWFYRLLYRLADGVVCQSGAMALDLARVAGIDTEQIAVLPNPVDLEGILAAGNSSSLWSGDGPHLLAVGRLEREKGFDLLIEAFATTRRLFLHADLIIAGAGREESTLQKLCRSLGLEDAVHFAGYVDNPYAYFPGAALFVLSSRHEGMPNALLEAAAAGLPLVATPASGGVVDLLRGQPGAWLASEISSESLANALAEALLRLGPEQRFCHAFISSVADSAHDLRGSSYLRAG